MNLTLHIWRQTGPSAKGGFKKFSVRDISEHCSFLEMLDILNEQLTVEGTEPIAFEHDCREGICGACGMVVNGTPHGPNTMTTTCQLHMRTFSDGDEIWIEPFRAEAFPVLKDLIVDRSSFDRIIQAGGYISVNTGNAQDANSTPIGKSDADRSMDAATCIGCGACVAACPNASAMLFTAAKVAHLNLLPQGSPERDRRTLSMIGAMEQEGFGNCTNHGACQNVCPKGIHVDYIQELNRDMVRACWGGRDDLGILWNSSSRGHQ